LPAKGRDHLLKYAAMIAGLKGFSATPATRKAYRKLGNVVETQRKLRDEEMFGYKVGEVSILAQFFEKYGELAAGERVLELGTGYAHWQSVVIRLFADVEVTMFDIVDNRLWRVFNVHMARLRSELPQQKFPAARLSEAERLLDSLSAAKSFDEVYDLLGAQYVLEADGDLSALRSDSYALILSLSVLEHVQRDMVPKFMSETRRLLQPGGYIWHSFDLSDHYSYFDKKMSPKNYLRYSPETWERWFSSRVMYINRIQRPEWDEIINAAGLEIVDCEVLSDSIGDIRIHPSYQLDADEAQTIIVTYVLRRRD